MKHKELADRERAYAAVLLWQSRYRLLLVLAIGSITVALSWTERLSTGSVVAASVGPDLAIAWTAVLAAAYVGFIGLLALQLQAKRRVGVWAVVATLGADIVAFHGAMLIAAPPEWYERALILSTFSVQLTLLYFGWRAAGWSLIGIVATYLGIVLVAIGAGSDLSLVESLWTLGIFSLALAIFITLQADLSDRLAMIVEILERAREGDYSLGLTDDSSEQPDRISLIGSAYNEMRDQLKSVILTDPLTKCFNARGFEQMSAREIARGARTGAPLAVLALDLDDFKSVNDTYGHLAGDELLREVGEILRTTARASDVIARTGGEEFTILAPDTDAAGATHFGMRLLAAFRAHRFERLKGRSLTVSIGIADGDSRTDAVMRLLRLRADEALYAAKRGGRDRAEQWRPGLNTLVV